MTFALPKIASIAAVALVAAGLGLYGAGSLAAGPGQESTALAVAVDQPDQKSVGAQSETAFQLATSPSSTPTSRRVPELSRQRKAIQEIQFQLDAPVDVDFIEVPLTEVVDYLSELLGIQIVIDRTSLQDAGIEVDELVVNASTQQLTARSTLRLILDAHRLEYVPTNEVLLITTPETAESRLDARVYLIDNLQIPTAELLEIIKATISPPSWNEAGGAGVVAPTGRQPARLVIAQSQRVHEQIVDLLAQLKLSE